MRRPAAQKHWRARLRRRLRRGKQAASATRGCTAEGGGATRSAPAWAGGGRQGARGKPSRYEGANGTRPFGGAQGRRWWPGFVFDYAVAGAKSGPGWGEILCVIWCRKGVLGALGWRETVRAIL